MALSEHLRKLAVVKSEEELENLLQLLWQTRKTGLSASQKSSVHSLLELPSPGDLDAVLPSLRSLVRNCIRSNLEGDDISKFLPPDVPLELQSMLLKLLQKHWSQWKGELSQEPHVFRQTRSSCQNTGLSAASLSFPISESSRSLRSQQVNPAAQLYSHHLGNPTPQTPAERNGNEKSLPQLTLQNDAIPPEFLGVLPRVKSMTWTVDNKSATPANRVAIITLKLQDYTKSPSNETQVKFQLTKDALDAVLRSMAYINEQLSRHVGSSSEPLQKKQRQ